MNSTSSGCPAILLLLTAPTTPSFWGTLLSLLLMPPPATLLLLLLPPLLVLVLVLVVGDAGVGDWGSEARVEAAHRRLDSSSAEMQEACGASCCMMALKACLCWYPIFLHADSSNSKHTWDVVSYSRSTHGALWGQLLYDGFECLAVLVPHFPACRR
jgi:hypothetical protein